MSEDERLEAALYASSLHIDRFKDDIGRPRPVPLVDLPPIRQPQRITPKDKSHA